MSDLVTDAIVLTIAGKDYTYQPPDLWDSVMLAGAFEEGAFNTATRGLAAAGLLRGMPQLAVTLDPKTGTMRRVGVEEGLSALSRAVFGTLTRMGATRDEIVNVARAGYRAGWPLPSGDGPTPASAADFSESTDAPPENSSKPPGSGASSPGS